ncbi:MDR family MFS transporter [Gordonia soli]|uniref:Putative drug resistance transporter n=1 Tax=Gordonia soli NBRC 108243 TaxID=1223545 RepID=M0QRW0_9ACTN|nr:MDR family MFS transporter [Gordonia soli]GAC70437.1 putative drug resistance transporter [Gordonia soli NBRC 108243]
MTAHANSDAAAPETPPPGDRLSRANLLLIAVLLVASFVVILNETVMSIAIPVLQEDLGVDPSVGQWLTTAFLLTMAVVIPLTGFLIQRAGARVLFIAAMSAFTAGTAVAFFAPNFQVLLVARVIQALGTAIMLPLLMTTVMTVVPEHRRGVMMGNISVVIAVAPALGPTVSGFILDHFGWRWIFGFVGPIAAVALIVGSVLVKPVGERIKTPIDFLSIPLAVLGFGGLVYGLAGIGEAAESGAAVPLWIPFTVGAVALAAFLGRQLALQRHDRALLDLRVFKSGQFSLAMVAMVVAMGTMLGTFIVVPYFAQAVLGLDPLTTGLLTLPGGLLMGLAGPIVGRIYDAAGPRVLTVPGAVIVSLGVWLLTTVDPSSSPWLLLGANALLCLGLAATFTPLMTLALGSVEPRLYSHGSAVLGTFQQVAGAAGTALFITVMTVVASGQREAGVANAEAISDGVQRVFLVAGLLSFVLIAVVAFVRKPAEPDVTIGHGATGADAPGPEVTEAIGTEATSTEATSTEATSTTATGTAEIAPSAEPEVPERV